MTKLKYDQSFHNKPHCASSLTGHGNTSICVTIAPKLTNVAIKELPNENSKAQLAKPIINSFNRRLN